MIVKKALIFIIASIVLISSYIEILPAAEIDINQVIWKTAYGKLEARSKKSLLLGGVDGNIYILNDKGEVLLKRNLDGIPSDIVAANIDGSPGDEIVASVMDKEGNIWMLDGKLNPVWQYSDGQTFFAVGAGDINSDGEMEIIGGSSSGNLYALSRRGKVLWKKNISDTSSISAIAVGDISSNQGDEIVVGTRQDGIYILDGKGGILKHVKPALNEAREKRHNKLFWIRNILIDDINNDDKKEIVIGSRPSGMVTVLNGEGELIWRTRFPNLVNRWSNSQIAIGNLTGDAGKEIICLLHGIVLGAKMNTTPLVVLDSQGKIISRIYPETSYLNINTVPSESGYDRILLGPTVRATKLYLAQLKDLSGDLKRAGLSKTDQATDRLYDKVAKLPSEPVDVKGEKKKIHILHHISFSEGLKEIERLYGFLKSRESDRLVFEIMIDALREKVSGEKAEDGKKKNRKEKRQAAKGQKKKGKQDQEQDQELDQEDFTLPKRFEGEKAYSQGDILEFVAEMEQKNIPFYLRVAKGNQLHLSLQTVERILIAAPRSCRGFIVNESSYTRRGFDSFVTSMEKIMELLAKHGEKKLILDQHFDFWFEIPSNYSIARRIFKPSFKNVLIPMYKTNRPHIPELNLGMIVGMWKSGSFNEWGYSAQDDVWKWESIFISRPPDVLLRMEVLAASLGAAYFRIEGNGEFAKKEGKDYVLDSQSKRHRDLFHSMIRKGVIIPADNSGQVLTSPVLFQRENDPQQMPKALETHHSYWIKKFQQRGLFSYEFPLKSVKDDYIPAAWTGMRYYYEGLLPKTPYGFVSFVPRWVDPAQKAWASQVFTAYGKSILDNEGNKIPQGQEKNVVMESLKKYNAMLPFSAENVVLTINKLDKYSYLLYLIDPNQFNVHDINTKLRLNVREQVVKVEDITENKPLYINNSEIQVTVPAGLFKILRVVLKVER